MTAMGRRRRRAGLAILVAFSLVGVSLLLDSPSPEPEQRAEPVVDLEDAASVPASTARDAVATLQVPETKVTLRVRDAASGTPIEATVRLGSRAGQDVRLARHGEAFIALATWEALDELQIESAEHWPRTWSRDDLPPWDADGPPVVVVELQRKGVLHVRVLDPAGAPVEGAWVDVVPADAAGGRLPADWPLLVHQPWNETPSSLWANTDDAGVVTVRDLPTGRALRIDGGFEIQGVPPGVATVTTRSPSQAAARIRVEFPETVVPDLQLEHLVQITGRVTLAGHGTPALYDVRAVTADHPADADLVDEGGLFALAVPPGPCVLTVHASRTTRASDWDDLVVVTEVEAPVHDMVLDVSQAVGGVEVRVPGAAQSELMWTFFPRLAGEDGAGEPRNHFSVISLPDPDGRSSVGELLPGPYDVLLRGKSGGAWCTEVIVRAGEILDLGARKLGTGLVRTVAAGTRDHDRPAAPPTSMRAVCPTGEVRQASSDERGEVILRLPAGPWFVSLSTPFVPFGPPSRIDVAPGSEHALPIEDLRDETAEVHGTVRQDGRPQPGALVRVIPATPPVGASRAPAEVAADASGRYRVRRLLAGDHRVVVRFAGEAEALILPLTLVAGDVRRLDLDVPRREARVRFTQGGEPIEFDLLSVVSARQRLQLLPDGEGAAVVPDLAEPTLFVLRLPGHDGAGRQVHLVAEWDGSRRLVDGAVIEVCAGTMEIEGSGARETGRVAATLVEWSGIELGRSMTLEQVLLTTPIGQGRSRVGTVPRGARVRLRGRAADGGRIDRVVVSEGSRTLIRW